MRISDWSSDVCSSDLDMATVPADMNDFAALRDANVPRGVATAHPICVERAQGSRVWATDGRQYLDFVGGIGVMNVGHTHPAVEIGRASYRESVCQYV